MTMYLRIISPSMNSDPVRIHGGASQAHTMTTQVQATHSSFGQLIAFGVRAGTPWRAGQRRDGLQRVEDRVAIHDRQVAVSRVGVPGRRARELIRREPANSIGLHSQGA